ncbi:hypothetical protein D3C71_1048070 [compost metagenome]
MFDAVQQLAFGEFQLQQLRRQPGLFQHLPHQTDQLALAQLMHRQIDRHPNRIEPLPLPLTGLPAGLTQHELTDRADQSGFFSQADEIPRRHAAHGRMIPTHQGFGGIQPASGQAQFRLVKHLQLFVFDGFAQVVFQL